LKAKIDANLWRWLQVVLGIALFAALSGCSHAVSLPPFSSSAGGAVHLSFLNPQGPVAAAQRFHFIRVFALTMVVVLPVLVLTPLFAWRYRYRNTSAPYQPLWSFSWPLEFVVWGIPFAIVIALAVWLWESAEALDPYSPLPSTQPPLRVQVVGYDWKWLFIYPDFKIATIGELAFPANRPLAIDLTSDTVMQSLLIPALGSQIYAMPGMVTRLHLQADNAGSFRGENTQYNGDGFYEQKFTATAMTPSDFQTWLNRVDANGIVLSTTAYAAIAQRSTLADVGKALGANQTQRAAIYFTAVPPGLFQKIVQSFHGSSSDAAALCGGAATLAHSGSGATDLINAVKPE
jgi:cytochrome o ubiquinol oxidase subunit II